MRQMTVQEMVEAGLLEYCHEADKGKLVPNKDEYLPFYPVRDVMLEMKHPTDEVWEQVGEVGIDYDNDGPCMYYEIAGTSDTAVHRIDEKLDVRVYRLETE